MDYRAMLAVLFHVRLYATSRTTAKPAKVFKYQILLVGDALKKSETIFVNEPENWGHPTALRFAEVLLERMLPLGRRSTTGLHLMTLKTCQGL